MTPQSTIYIAYSRLVGLKENFPEASSANGELIHEFHEIINDLEALNCDLSKFRIPPSAINNYGNSSWCDATLFKSKVSGLLTYFDVSTEPRRIGFEPPK